MFASRRALRGYAAAADRDQARLLRDAVDTLARLNPWLAAILKVDQWKITNTRTGSTLEIISSDAPTSYGLTPDFIIADEVVHWLRRDLWDSLISAAAKRARCMVVVISNAGYGESWQWAAREAVRQDPAWFFSRLDGPAASWITADRLAEQRRLLPPVAYRRLWLNEWTAGSGDALDAADIERAVRLRGPLRRAPRGWAFAAGLDLGLTRDAAALAVVGYSCGYSEERPRPPRQVSGAAQALVELGLAEQPEEQPEYIHHRGSGRLRLARLAVWQPPSGGKVSIEVIENEIAALHGLLTLTAVGADPWQAAYLIERLQKRGIAVEAVDPTGANLKSMCSATLEAFSEGQIDLYPHPRLLSDLRALRAVEKSYGVRLESPRGPQGHGDAATALAIALHILRLRARSIAITHEHRYSLITYP
jgi:phage terminase large subunit-like protein